MLLDLMLDKRLGRDLLRVGLIPRPIENHLSPAGKTRQQLPRHFQDRVTGVRKSPLHRESEDSFSLERKLPPSDSRVSILCEEEPSRSPKSSYRYPLSLRRSCAWCGRWRRASTRVRRSHRGSPKSADPFP